MADLNPWRAHGGSMPIVPFDQQLDKFSLWIETWSHPQRCELIEQLLYHMKYDQHRLLWTVMQPSLHRDFMYSAQINYPRSNFQPISTHSTRKLRENIGRFKRNNFYRVKSAYCEFPEEIFKKNLLPELVKLRQLSFDAQVRRKTRPTFSAKPPLPQIYQRSITAMPDLSHSQQEKVSPLLRSSNQPVRRHIQQESIQSDVTEVPDLSTPYFQTLKMMPPNAIKVVNWYINDWSDAQKNEFLVKLLLKLDERQHFFISNLLSVKQYKDFISLLPLNISLKILSYLTPKQLAKASRVCKTWKKVCERNELWRAKCKELDMNMSDYQPSSIAPHKVNYKKILRGYLSTLDNWETGKFREIELKGHTQNVQCVCLEASKLHSRLATGSLDKSIKVWDIMSGNCLMTLRGHSKGIWCLSFFTSSMLISGSYDNTIRIWNLQTGKCIKTLLGHDGPVWSIKRFGNKLVSGSQDRSIKVWDVRRCVLEKTLTGHQAAIFCVDITSSGEYAFSASADHTVRIWNVAENICQKVIHVNQSTAVMTVSYNQGYLACSYGEVICVYRIGSSMDSATLVKTYEEHHKRIESVQLSVTDPLLGHGAIVSAGKDGLIKYWGLTDDKSMQTIKASADSIACVTFDKHRIAMASKDNKIKIFDFTAG